VHYDGAKPQNCIVEKFCTTGGQSLLSLSGTVEKKFSIHFKRYNLTIRKVNFFETFCTCSPSSLVQDPIVKISKIELSSPFLLTELEMADLSIFFEENDLRSLGVKKLTLMSHITLWTHFWPILD
jgi:hypothetical protein